MCHSLYFTTKHSLQLCHSLQLTKKHRNGHIAKVDWLDRLTFREIEMINEREKRNSDYLYLMVEFPLVELEGTPVSL
jgi:phosphatidylinositol 3-kinase